MRYLCAVIICFVASHLHSQVLESQHYKPSGRLIDVNGRKLHLDCTGSGSPVVILVAGGDAFSIDWALVQPRVAQKTRVCSYDRAGLAWGDPSPADETVEQTIADLHALLRTAGERGPYILVGASIGGIFIRAYQRAFPKDVSALVFSNSANHVGLNLKGKVGLLWNLTEDEIRAAYPLPASARGLKPTHEGDPFDRLPIKLQNVRLWLDTQIWEKWNPATTGPGQVLSWRKEFLREFDETENGGRNVLGALPVIVVSSNPTATESECHSRGNAAVCLDFLSSDTVHITATESGHEIHLYQPDTVVRALLQAVSAVRNGVPLSGSLGAKLIDCPVSATQCARARPSPPASDELSETWAGHRIVTLEGFGDYFISGEHGQAQLIKPEGLGVNIVAVVQRVEGDLVWIKANGAGDVAVGWVNKKNVILLEDAIPYFTSLVGRNSADWDAYLRRAESEHALNQREAAIADYTRAIDLHPDEPFLFLRRGRTFRTIKDCPHAAADFEKAAHLKPQWAEPYNLAAGVYADCPDPTYRDPEKATSLIEHAIALDIEHPTYLTVLALAYFRSGKLEQAVVTQRQALESPRFLPAYREEATKQLHEYEGALGSRKH
jgi:pimeloyl-ACP methyl ester carboxylesterase